VGEFRGWKVEKPVHCGAVRGIFGDLKARVIALNRRSKKTACGCCGRIQMGWYDRARDLSCGDTRTYLELEVRRVGCRRCGTVKREWLDLLADNPLYTETPSALLTLSADAAGERQSRRWRTNWRRTGTRSRRWTSNTWKPN
jgi:transposase